MNTEKLLETGQLAGQGFNSVIAVPLKVEVQTAAVRSRGAGDRAIPLGHDLRAKERSLRSMASREQTNAWFALRPARVYRDLLLHWGLIFAALYGAAHFQRWWAYAAATVVVGISQYGLFILAHDGLHKSLHPNRRVNDFIVRWLIYGPFFMCLEDARRNHLHHHRTVGTEEDTDRYLHLLSNKNTPLKFLLFCSGLATFGPTVLKVMPQGALIQNLLGKEAKEVEAAREETAPVKKGLMSESIYQRRSVLLAQPVLVGLFLLMGLPLWSYPLLWLAPIYLFVFLPDELRAFADHAVPEKEDKEGDPHRLVSFKPSFFEGIFFSPHNMNLHSEHHLWPGLPYYNLPKAHSLIKERPEVTVRRSYLRFFLSVLKQTGKGKAAS
jgi:fatty acid desaturase